MLGVYKGKKVKITKLVLSKSEFIKSPLLIQVRIEWKEDGKKMSDYVDANSISFID